MTPTRKHPNRRTQKENVLAFDYRRYITLVQVLALDDEKAVLALCRQWGIEPGYCYDYDHATKKYDRIVDLDWQSTLRELARHAIEYHRKEPKP